MLLAVGVKWGKARLGNPAVASRPRGRGIGMHMKDEDIDEFWVGQCMS